MARVAIIGSCITRDLWPARGEGPADILYISRTSLPSLLSRPLNVTARSAPPEGLTPFEHRSVVWDLKKQALPLLVAYRPTHLIFDFIDERYDLLSVDGRLANHTWELQTSGYLSEPPLNAAETIARMSLECERRWRRALRQLLGLIASTPLAGAQLILHRAQWAEVYQDESGALRRFEPHTPLLEGRTVDLRRQNALLERYQIAFAQEAPACREVAAPSALRIATCEHRWGLSPFHFIPEYYREVRRQLVELGVEIQAS